MQAIAVLASYFPGAVPEPTGRAWASAIIKYEYVDTLKAAEHLATTIDRPTLALFCRAIESQRDKRLSEVPALPPGEISDEQAQRNAQKAREIIDKLSLPEFPGV